MSKDEEVFCLMRADLEPVFGGALPQGVFAGVEPESLLGLVQHFLPRLEAEHDTAYKQLIPYVLIICNDKILRYRRGRGGQETRLHGLFSVGIGGHISEEDHGLFSSGGGYHEGMRREVMEEVAVDEVKETAVAVINDDSTEVGQVHFGVVHIMHVANESFAGRRSGIAGPEFIPITEAVNDPAGYESWSRFCLEKLDLLFSKAGASGAAVPERVTG